MFEPEHSLDETRVNTGWFRTTHWSVVLAVGGTDPLLAEAALERLCQAYWYPLYSFVRRSEHNPEDAKDLTQGFFAMLLERGSLKSVQRGETKFRSFLLTALKRFLVNEWHRARTLKRGGGQELIHIDEADTENRCLAEPADAMSPERVFERRWAQTLLDRVLARLQTQFADNGKAALFEQLTPFLSGEKTSGCYPEISQNLGMSEGSLRVAVHRLRQRYRELLRMEIADTVSAPEEIEDEIRHLFRALA